LLNAHNIIVLLFTEQYLRSVPIFMVWSTAIVFAILPTNAVLRVFAQTRFMLVLNIISLVLIASGIKWFLLKYDLIGAVLITVITAAFAKGLALLKVKSLLRVSIHDLLPWRSLTGISLAATAACLPTLVLQHQLQLPVHTILAISGVFYTSLFLALIVTFRVLTEDEMLSLTGWVRKSWATMPRRYRSGY